MRIQKTAVSSNNDYEKMPILFCIFNKLETTPKVFNAIRKSRPKRLYISSDGAREEKEGEKKKVEALREFILKNIDWDCEVFTKFSEKNLACKEAMNSAIDWFFENEEMGIILEDDTLPAPSFFRFCSELLQKYKNDEKVYLISGYYGNAKKSSSNKYFFKQEPNTWGWATWRRAWRKHDRTITDINWYKKQIKEADEKIINAYKNGLLVQIETILSGEHKTWDIPWWFSIINNGGLCILPECNLITNIGTGVPEAFSTDFEYDLGGNIPAGEFLFPVEHPQQILPRPITDEEFAEDFIRYTESFSKKEKLYAGNILAINNLLAKLDFMPLEEKHRIMRIAESDNLYELLQFALKFGNYQKAQKYLYLALTKSLFAGSERDACDKCRKCLSVCPSKSFNLFKEKEHTAVGINKKTCEFCWKCMKNCPFVNPK